MTREEIQTEINTCKQLLTQTDYRCLKYAEGALTEEEFAPTHAQRQEWRERINELEEQLEEFEQFE